MSELRYHPFLDQWVITATHRQDRTFFPPPDYNPLAPTKPGGFPTEVPFESYDLVVFENKFPSLRPHPSAPEVASSSLTPVRPSGGVCEVVCYTQDAESSFAQLPFSQVRKLVRVWRDRYEGLGARPEVEYVFIFENKGKEIGVTLSHPHGQIYAYPFVPPVPREELQQERAYFEAHGRPLMAAVLEETLPTVVWQNELFVAFVPFFARYPYEVYIAPRVQLRSLAGMGERELDLLAEAMLVLARKYDQLFGFSMPYIMAMHQEPSVPGYEFAWFHVEFYPPYRTATKLKYLAGSEAGAGAFINDTLPEVTAATLRSLEVASLG
jgi:UDPglucose--hexose-1-phosphate uridylyltransferase